jgi:hypothetical protein
MGRPGLKWPFLFSWNFYYLFYLFIYGEIFSPEVVIRVLLSANHIAGVNPSARVTGGEV